MRYLQTIYVAATQDDTNWEAHERACFAATYPTARTDAHGTDCTCKPSTAGQ